MVREVFTLFSQGYGKTAIARMLNDRGIPNPTEYKRLHGLRYQQPKRKNSQFFYPDQKLFHIGSSHYTATTAAALQTTAREVNQLNRIKLMLSVAFKNIYKDKPPIIDFVCDESAAG